MKKMDIDDKENYNRNRIVSGYGPHKILDMEIAKIDDKDIFAIDNIKWKFLDEDDENE
jgi:hypothetical protein